MRFFWVLIVNIKKFLRSKNFPGISDKIKEKYSLFNENEQHFQMYKALCEKGSTEIFILNPRDDDNNKNHIMFEFKNGKCNTRKEFKRIVRF